MKLRLPLLLLSVVMAAYSHTSAYGASFDLNGTDSADDLILLDGESLTNSVNKGVTYSGTLDVDGAVSIGGAGAITLGGSLTGSGDIIKTGNGSLTFGKALQSTYKGNLTVAGSEVLFESDFGAGNTITVGEGATLTFFTTSLQMNSDLVFEGGNHIYHRKEGGGGAAVVKGTTTFNANTYYIGQYAKNLIFEGSIKGSGVFEVRNAIYGEWNAVELKSANTFSGTFRIATMDPPETYDPKNAKITAKHDQAMEFASVELLGTEKYGEAQVAVETGNLLIKSLYGNEYSSLFTSAKQGNKVTLKEGGTFFGTLTSGLDLETNGTLVLGRSGEGQDINSVVSGTGDIVVKEGLRVNLTKANTYTGRTVLNTGTTLALNAGGSISGSSSLVMNGASLIVNGGATVFGGLQLADGSSSSITIGSGASLTTGAITGLGSLLLSGTDTITGTIAADRLFSITFQQGNDYYNAKISGSNITKGDVFGDLQAGSNDGSKSFTFRNGADLTMNNAAGTLYTIGNLAVSGEGKTLTLGAGGLKINGSLTYTSEADKSMTIGGGALETGGLIKKGAGGILFNSQVTAGGMSVEGSATFANGGTVTGQLSGSGTINVKGGYDKVFSVAAGASSEGFIGKFDIAGGSRVQMNGAGITSLAGVSGAGTLEVNAGTVNIKGALTTAPEGKEGDISMFTGTALSIGKDGTVAVDHTALTANGATDKPFAPRTIMGLTGSGTLVLNTIGGDTSGGTSTGYMGSFVYAGDAGFTGTIRVNKGFLAIRAGEWDEAKVILDGGGFSDGCYWQGASITNTRKNDIEIGEKGAVLRLFSNNTLVLSGDITGTGRIQRVDAGSLEFSGDMSGYTGDISISGGATTTKFTGITSMGVLSFDNDATISLTGKTTSLGGILHKNVKSLTIDTEELAIGAGGIKSNAESWSLAAKVGKFKASADWTLASNVTLQQTAGTGFVMDTQGHDVTFDGNLGFGSGVAVSGRKIVKSGAGTWILRQNALPDGSSVEVNGGTLRYEGNQFSSAVSFANGGILSFSQNQKLTKSVIGNGVIQLDKDIQLEVSGLVFNGHGGLNLNGGNVVLFSGNGPGTQNLGDLTVSSTGNTIRFGAEGDMILNMSNALLTNGAGLLIDGYEYSNTNYLKMNGLTAWEKLQGVTLRDKDGVEQEAMVDTRGRLTAYVKDVIVGSLVSSGIKSDGSGYEFGNNAQYYGALAGKDVNFTEPFTFASGASNYGFTTRDDSETGMSAGSFTVSAQLTDGNNATRTVSVLGQAGASDRTVTFTNTANSFTDNVTVTQAVLKAKAADPEAIGMDPVRILGVNNSIYLNENATLDLATGEGEYVYSNNFILNGDGAVLKQTDGQHVLTGDVTLSGAGNGSRTIENTLSEGALTLTGNMTSRGGGTLVLQTQTSEDSRIILSLKGDSSLNRLIVNGHVEQTRNTLSVAGGLTLGNQSSWLLSGGTLAVGESLTSAGGASRTVTFGNGTSLRALGSRLTISSGVVLAFAHEQSSFAIDSGDGVIDFRGTLGAGTSNNTLTKKGQGTLEWGESTSTEANLKLEQGVLTLKENVNFSTTGDVNVQRGSVLNLEKGSSLSISPNSGFVFNGSLTGSGSLSGMNNLVFGSDARYAAQMSGQSWGVVFQNGATFSGSLLKHAGNIVFEEGSHIRFDTTLPVSDKSIGISTTGGSTVRFNGAIVSGSTATPDVDWDATQSYEFTLVSSLKELLGEDGKTLSLENLDQSVTVGDDGWGAFLSGELGLSADGKQLLVTVTRNENSISTYARTGNQAAVAGALDYAMDNYSKLGIRGTELGDIIQYFNKMGQNIAAEAPEALGMVGGLSNYQALAGQRGDMMRHVEAVRQRANAGKGLVGISNIPDNSFWAEGTQSYSRVDGEDHSTPGYTAQTWGAAIGMDYLSGSNYSLGVAFAYSNLKVDSDQYAGQTKSDNYYVDLYGRWESGNWNGVVVLSGGTADVDVKRTLNVGSDTYQGKGSTDGTQIVGMAEVAYDWQWEEEGPVLQPYVGMTIGQSKLDGYTESGMGNASLVMDEQKQMVVQGSLGVRLYKQNIDREMQYETSRWELRAGLVEEFGDTDFVTRSSFIGLPGYTMSTTSDDIGRTGLQIGGGFSYALDQAWSLFGDVNGEFRNGQTSMNSTLGLRCTF